MRYIDEFRRSPVRSALLRALLVGTTLQALTVIAGHFGNLLGAYATGFLFACMMISATVTYLFAQEVGPGYARGAYSGAIIGGLCALVGLAISVPLGDLSVRTVLQRSVICVLTGGVGGLYGQMAFDWRSLI